MLLLMNGDELFEFVKLLFPLNRSITGMGTRKTLDVIKQFSPDLKIISFPSGTKCFDWEIPLEWNVASAYIIDPNGEKIIDFLDNNLHLVSYSEPVNRKMSLGELSDHLFSLPHQPNLIPYRTSYYESFWGFCLKDEMRQKLVEGEYTVCIDSSLEPGSLDMGEIYIEGLSKSEIVFSTYICHPSMANNELSGPAIAVALSQFLRKNQNYYSYRILFMPETIGAISYLSLNYSNLKNTIIAGYILTCLGDNNKWSFLPSRTGITLSDKVALRNLAQSNINYTQFNYLHRGSDERQFCSPLVDLPFCSVMRSKYGTFDVYHTSGDDLSFISKDGLEESLNFYIKVIESFEKNRIPKSLVFCEPMFSKRNLRSTIGGSQSLDMESSNLSHITALADGNFDYEALGETLNLPQEKIASLCALLAEQNIIRLL